VGEWKNGLRNGFGKQTNSYENIYEGEWLEDKKSGNGTFTWKDGSKYVGEWKNDLRNGFGKETIIDEWIYEGEWQRGKKSGNGTYIWKDG